MTTMFRFQPDREDTQLVCMALVRRKLGGGETAYASGFLAERIEADLRGWQRDRRRGVMPIDLSPDDAQLVNDALLFLGKRRVDLTAWCTKVLEDLRLSLARGRPTHSQLREGATFMESLQDLDDGRADAPVFFGL